jgi:hypothetical protein
MMTSTLLFSDIMSSDGGGECSMLMCRGQKNDIDDDGV